MARFFKNKNARTGQVPGQMTFIGTRKVEKVSLYLMDYNKEMLREEYISNLSEHEKFKGADTVTWLDITGLHDLKFFDEVEEKFHLHPLMMEDIVDTGQRPKVEEYSNCLFITLKMMRYNKKREKVIAEQVSIIILPHMLITVQEESGDVFGLVRERLRHARGRIRSAPPEYLAYAILDTIVDEYLVLLERMGSEIEELELKIMNDEPGNVIDEIKYYKRELSFFRKSIRPAKEVVIHLNKPETPFIDNKYLPFFRDLLDLVMQVNDATDSYREMLTDQITILQTNASNKMNEIMKVLTIFAAIFIPLTFVAGIYGTNFEHMPELGYRYSYFIFWGVLIVIGLAMLRYFRNKGWL